MIGVLAGIRCGNAQIGKAEFICPLADKRWQISEFRVYFGIR
jgi:hypothetical protein